jgi:LacI family gluconate utilization system Gnt-I transcriptional repressor
MLALGAIVEAQARGVPVPDAVAIVGYGDLNFAADTIPSLTTVSVDGPAIGRLAARLIIERAQGRVGSRPHRRCRLFRSSSAQAPRPSRVTQYCC